MDAHEAANILSGLQRLFGYTGSDMAIQSKQLGVGYELHPNFIANIRNKGVVPNLRRLYAISEIFQMTIGSTFAVFGFDLDAILRTELVFNAERTRLIEHRFFGDGALWVPGELGPDMGTDEIAFLRQLVPRWQAVSPERLWGADWAESSCLYGKLGIHDSRAAPDIPPGAYLQILRLRERSLEELSPEAFYFVQHPQGYIACRCGTENGTLVLYPNDPSFSGKRRWKLRSEARILGIVTGFAAALPAEGYRRSSAATAVRRSTALALAPWEHTSLASLYQTSCERFGLNPVQIDQFNAALFQRHGIHISGKYGRTLHRTEGTPQTASTLAMAVTASLRLRDVFRASGFTLNDRNKHSLEYLLKNVSAGRSSSSPSAMRPVPEGLWTQFLQDWKEWPLLLERVLSEPETFGTELIRLNHPHAFRGMERLLRQGAFLRIDPKPVSWNSINRDTRNTDWARSVYVIEYGRESPSLLCTYLEVEGGYVILSPHPAARAERSLKYPRSEVHILGKVVGVMARLP